MTGLQWLESTARQKLHQPFSEPPYENCQDYQSKFLGYQTVSIKYSQMKRSSEQWKGTERDLSNYTQQKEISSLHKTTVSHLAKEFTHSNVITYSLIVSSALHSDIHLPPYG
ncbi:hypothetical protein TNCV_765991 [Trichonephila clavipes]|nr:hypothetical protein TNCV_765991 [Trichonephila clavipes]